MAAIFAYIEIAVLRVLAFSEDLLRYVNILRSGVLRHHYIIEFLYISGFFLLNQVCAQKTQFCCGRVNCRDLRQNVVGRQRMKINKTILLRESRRRLILVFSETPIANLRRFLVSTLASEVASQTFISTRSAAVFPRFL